MSQSGMIWLDFFVFLAILCRVREQLD